MTNKQLVSLISSMGVAVGAFFVAFGHSDLSAPAQTAFVSGATVIFGLIHFNLSQPATTTTVAADGTKTSVKA